MPLGKAIVDSAINASSRDPRFARVRPGELKRIVVEVTILTKPKTYDVPKKKLPELVRVGKDGLIVTKGPFSGLLLPQVAPEWGFDSLEFLGQTCVKAGLPPDAWLDEDTEVQHFEAQIFAEVAPWKGGHREELLGHFVRHMRSFFLHRLSCKPDCAQL